MERGSPLLRRRRGFCALDLLLLMVIFLASSIKAQDFLSLSDASSGEMHREGYCSMYGICAQRSDGKVLNCASGSFSTKPSSLLSSKIQTLCPTMTGNVCCNAAQFETLREQVQQAVPLLVGCPACLRNFLNLFCELSCSPNQSLFINVTSAKQVNNTMTVNAIDFFLTNTYGEELYNSCKDVKFGSINTRVMDFIGAGAQNYKDFLAFLGRQAALNAPGSPYKINFQSTTPLSSQMKPINSTVYSCADSLLGCSCGDCFSSSACSAAAPSSPLEKGSCKIAIGLVKVKCIELSLAILYLVVISGFLLWVFLRKGERGPLSESKHLLNDNGENDLHTGYKQTNTIPQMNMSEGLSLVKVLRPSIVQDSMARVFRKYGAFVSRRPTFVLFLSLAVPVLLIIGLINFRVETKPEKLWVGNGSRAAEEKHFFDHHLAPFYRIEQLVLATVPLKNAKAPSIVTDQNMKLLFELQKKVDELHVTYSGSMVSLADICMKPLADDCATQSVLQYFKMDQERYDNYGGVQHAEYCFEHFYSEESCRSAFQAPLDPGTVLGGFPESNYSEASALIITYPVNNEVGNTGDENGKAVAWERAFIRLVKEELMPMVQLQNLTLSFSSESSIQDELERESSSDVVTILVSYVVMFAYISFMLGDTPTLHSCFVTSKVLLGLSGVIVVMLSVLGSIGFYSAMGVKSTLIIMEVIPFLVLAVGVDNMCILLHAVKRQATEMSLESKISNALMEVGPSITLASLSEVLAFAAGSFIPMPAVRVFSMFAAFAVFLDFILQVTAFVALIIFDFSRSNDERIDCFPCIKLSSSSGSERVSSVVQRKPGLLVRYMEDFHAPMLAVPGVKYAVIALFTAATFLSIALCTRIQPGLEQKIVLPRNSYLQGYFDDLARYLRVGPPLYFVVKDFNYSLESNQTNKICSISQCDSNSLLNEITRASLIPETSFIAKPAASWLDDFLGWLSPKAFSCCRKFINGSYCPPDDQAPCCQPNGVSCDISGICKDCTTCFHQSDMHEGRPSTAQFKEKLPWFLKASPSANCAKGGNGAYTSSIDLTGFNTGIIQASSFRTYHKPLSRQIDYVNAMKAARDFSSRVSDSLKLQVFPYSVYYIYFEQYINIWKTALINIAIGLGAVFIICLIITCSLWTSAIILLVLAMIILDIMGVMAILKIQLNAISVVNLVMSIGIAVEFCVHITHAFVVSSGNRGSRMKEALSTMGASVFSGITLTKLVGVIVLCFAKSQVFVVFYFQMYLALVLIGSLHGLVFLPVLLSICGPPSRWVVKKVPQEQPAVEAQAN